MNVPRRFIRDYAICVACLGLGLTIASFGGALPLAVSRGIAWLAICGVGVTTFRWAKIRGYPAFDKEGRVQLGHIIRSLVMTGVMSVVVVLASAPIFILVTELSKK